MELCQTQTFLFPFWSDAVPLGKPLFGVDLWQAGGFPIQRAWHELSEVIDEDSVPQGLRFLGLVQRTRCGWLWDSLAQAVVQRGIWPFVLIIQRTAWLTSRLLLMHRRTNNLLLLCLVLCSVKVVWLTLLHQP